MKPIFTKPTPITKSLWLCLCLLFTVPVFAQTPTLQTRKATNVNAITPHSDAGSFTATLNGIVNANGTNCYVFFEYGETENYGFNVSATPGTVTGSSDVNISADITIPNNQLSSVRTKINFRIKVINENDTYCSQNFVATAVNPTRKIDIQPEYSNGSNSLMTLINYNSYDVTVVYKDVNSVTVYAMQTSEIYVPENEVITFEYDYILFRQILPTTRLSTEPKLSRDYIRIKNLGRINSSNVQLYKIYNLSSTQAINVSVEEVPSATNITIEANSAVFFVEQAGGYAPTISVDGVQFANVSPDVYYYEEGFYLDIQSLSSTPSSATFEIYNRDDVAHTYVFRNASGTEHTYTLNGYEIQNITLSNEVWDVYITVYDKDEPDSYSFIRTGNTFGYAEYALNGKLKIASAIPGSSITTSVTPASIASSTSLTLNGVISNSAFANTDVDYHFIYGTDPNNLNQSTSTQNGTVQALGSLNANATVTGLTDGTLYYYNLVAGEITSASGKIFLSSSIPSSNLKLWLRSDLAVTSASSSVSTWGDVSGLENDATQSTGGNQPTWVESVINGNPALQFNGTSSKMSLPTSSDLGIQSNPYEFFVVGKSSSSNVQFLIAGGALEQFEYHLNGSTGARFIPTTLAYIDKGTAGSYTNGSAHLFSARASASGGAVRVDGVDGGTSESNLLSSDGGNLLLGVRGDGTYYFNGDIAEVIIYNRVLSAEERTSVEQYLKSRYAISGNTTNTFQTAGNWSVAGNWSNGLPETTTNVTIAANCTFDGNYEVADLTIDSGKMLTIAPNYTLTVNGKLTNNNGTAGLIIQSDETGTGMLMNNTTNVKATIQQYLVKEQWHYMGIPVTEITDVQTVYQSFYVSTIIEANATDGAATGWTYLQSGDAMQKMHGYAVRYGWSPYSVKADNATITFTGELNAGNQTINLDYSSAGWNFISNPFPVTIDWDKGISYPNTGDAIYVWNSGSYASYVGTTSTNGQSNYISPMQGFFVHATEAGASVNFSDASKTATLTAFKSATIDPLIRLAVSSNNVNDDEMVIRINPSATTAFDSHLDAYKLKAVDSNVPQLYSVIGGVDYSINSIPEITENLIITLEIMVKTTGENKLVLKERENYNNSYPLSIFNEAGELLANLEQEDYKFLGIEGETVKLLLAFSSSSPLAVNQLMVNDISLSTIGQNLVINRLQNIPSEVLIYNVSGQSIYRKRVTTDQLMVLVPKQGVYLVKVLAENGIQFNGKAAINF